jgi:hypothetical protein
VIARARTMVLASGLVQGSERSVVESTNPNMSYYFLAGVDYAHYFITWKGAEREGLLVHGQGNMLTLVGAEVKRFSGKAERATSVRARPLRGSQDMKQPPINLQIQANEVKVVDEDGHDLGVFAFADAIKLVASRREDLVEIEPDASPPLCQCIDYGKFRYRQFQDARKRRGL